MKKCVFIFFTTLIVAVCNNAPDNTIKKTDSVHDTIIKQQDTVTINNTATADSPKTKSNSLLVAGKSVGKIALGMNASNLQDILGKPDMSDAAMGKAWTTWYGKKPDEHNNKTELDIYTAYKDTGMRQRTVQQVRTTSSFFITQDGVHVYSALDDIKHKYAVNKAGKYISDGRTITIYDDKEKGIAFEIADANTQNICVGIIIHTKGKSVNDIYIMLHPDMKRYDK